jgi:hypothetical protein
MPFTVTTPIPLYAGLSGLAIRICVPGSPARVNGSSDDAMTDDSDGFFTSSITEDLVGTYTYVIRRNGAPIQSGWLVRQADQAQVILDDPRSFTPNIVSGTNGNGDRRISISATSSSLGVRGVRVSVAESNYYDVTNPTGDASLNLPTGQAFTLIVTPPSGYSPVEDIVVPAGSTTFNVPIELETRPVDVSESPYSSVTLPIIDLGGSPLANVKVSIEFLHYLDDADRTAVIAPGGLTATSNSEGFAVVRLLQKAAYRATYKVLMNRDKSIVFETSAEGFDRVVEPLKGSH